MKVVVATDRSETARTGCRLGGRPRAQVRGELVLLQVLTEPAEGAEEALAADAPRERARARSCASTRTSRRAIVRAAEEEASRRARRRQRGHGRAQGVPARQHPEPRLARGDAAPSSSSTRRTARSRSPQPEEVEDAGLLRRAAQIARVFARFGLDSRAAASAVGPREAAARGARGARADVREARPDPFDAARPRSAGRRRRAREAAGRRRAADRGGDRPRDGAGAAGPVGGRLRVDRADAARRGDDRAGAPRDARERRPRHRQGAAAARARGDHARPRPARALRGEGARARDAARRRRHPRARRPSLGVAAARARLPAGGGATSSACASCSRRTRASACRASTASCRPRGCSCSSSSKASPIRESVDSAAAPRGGAPAARGVLQADPHRGLLPRRSAPRQPALDRREDRADRPRDDRRARTRGCGS